MFISRAQPTSDHSNHPGPSQQKRLELRRRSACLQCATFLFRIEAFAQSGRQQGPTTRGRCFERAVAGLPKLLLILEDESESLLFGCPLRISPWGRALMIWCLHQGTCNTYFTAPRRCSLKESDVAPQPSATLSGFGSPHASLT